MILLLTNIKFNRTYDAININYGLILEDYPYTG